MTVGLICQILFAINRPPPPSRLDSVIVDSVMGFSDDEQMLALVVLEPQPESRFKQRLLVLDCKSWTVLYQSDRISMQFHGVWAGASNRFLATRDVNGTAQIVEVSPGLGEIREIMNSPDSIQALSYLAPNSALYLTSREPHLYLLPLATKGKEARLLLGKAAIRTFAVNECDNSIWVAYGNSHIDAESLEAGIRRVDSASKIAQQIDAIKYVDAIVISRDCEKLACLVRKGIGYSATAHLVVVNTDTSDSKTVGRVRKRTTPVWRNDNSTLVFEDPWKGLCSLTIVDMKVSELESGDKRTRLPFVKRSDGSLWAIRDGREIVRQSVDGKWEVKCAIPRDAEEFAEWIMRRK